MISVQGDKNPEYFGKINSLYRKEYYQARDIMLNTRMPADEACDMARKLIELNIKYDKKHELS